MKILLVINPIAGGKDKKVFKDKAENLFTKYGIKWDYFHTSGKNDAQNLRKKIQLFNPDRIASIGGDGTTLLTCTSLKDIDVPFGIIPMGSANGMARELNVSPDATNALMDIIMSEVIIPLDLISINEKHYSIHLGDVGANAQIVEKFSKEEGRGWVSYAKHFLEVIKNTEKFKVKLKLEGNVVEHEAFDVIIANARMYGTGAVVNPKGNPHDGKFEIVVVKQSDLSGIINLGLTSISDKAIENLERYYEIYQVKDVEISFEDEKLLQLDGELTGRFSTLNVKILPAFAQIISTSENSFLV